MKKRRRKRKSRTELYRVRATRANMLAHVFVTRIPQIVPGGNPFGLGEYTLVVARGPAVASRGA